MVDARSVLGVVTLACLLAVTGCTSDEPAGPAPSPTPVVQTPTETTLERQQRLDYAAAEKAYRTFRAEYNRVLRAGGAKKPTKLMKATAGGSYLAELTEVIVAYDGIGGHDSGKEKIVYVRPDGHSARAVILEVCEDGRPILSVAPRRRLKGELRVARLEVRKVGNSWKLWSGTGQKVSSCA